MAELGEMEHHAVSIRHITPNNEQDTKHYQFTWSEIWGKNKLHVYKILPKRGKV